MKEINIDVNGNTFLLTDSVKELLANKRLLISLSRLNFSAENDQIIIPFKSQNQIQILQELSSLLNKYGYSSNLSKTTKKNVENFERENYYFDEFALKAKSIRNDEFHKYPELILDYTEFKDSLNSTLKRNLYPLQELAAFHMAFAQNSCNFAVPGAGKTSIVYGAYSYLKGLSYDNPKHVDKLLVIGPLSSFAPWINEFSACFGRDAKFQRLSGDSTIKRNKKLEHLYSGSPVELTLISHGGVDSFQSDILEFLKNNKTMVVVDEAHRIKNPDGKWGKSVVEISKEAKSRVVLTGTPVPNGYQDIYNLYKFIYPFKFKEILKFHYQNLEDLTNNSTTDSPKVQELKDNISPFFIRIKKDDLGLPPTIEKVISVEMASYQREIYDFIESNYIKSFRTNDSATIKEILNRAKLIRLRQASTNPSLLSKTLKNSLENNENLGEYDPNAQFTNYSDEFVDDSEFFHKICNYAKVEIPIKFQEIKRIIKSDILPTRGKAIIWTIFIQNAKELQIYLSNFQIASKLLIGEVEQFERETIIEKFNNPDNNEFQVIIANPFSVAESISLHKGCHNAIYLERDYNCSNFLQSKDRIHRVGLKSEQITTYYYIICSNSIDEVINEKLGEKINRMEKIMNDDIPLFRRINDDDESDLIKALILNYAKRA